MKKLCIGNFFISVKELKMCEFFFKTGKAAMERYGLLKVAFRDKALS
jgi:hypothetical protein